jgi:hypothetical protein
MFVAEVTQSMVFALQQPTQVKMYYKGWVITAYTIANMLRPFRLLLKWPKTRDKF